MIQDEWFLGTIGIKQLLGDKKLRISSANIKRAAKAEDIVIEYAKEFGKVVKPITFAFKKEQLKLADYNELAEALSDEMGTESAANPDLADHLQSEIAVGRLDCYNYLKSQLPTSITGTGILPKDIEPCDIDKYRFLWQADIVDDVETALKLMNAGAFTQIETMCLRTLFPDIHQAMLVHYLEAIIDNETEENKGFVSSWKASSLSALSGVPLVSFQDLMVYQSGYEEKTAGQPRKNTSSKIVATEATDTQRVSNRKAFGA